MVSNDQKSGCKDGKNNEMWSVETKLKLSLPAVLSTQDLWNVGGAAVSDPSVHVGGISEFIFRTALEASPKTVDRLPSPH